MLEVIIALGTALLTLLLKWKRGKAGKMILAIPLIILVCQIIGVGELKAFYDFNKGPFLVAIIFYQFFLSAVLYRTGFFKWSAHTIVFTAEKSELKLLFHILIFSIVIAVAFNTCLGAVLITLTIFDISEATDLSYGKLMFFIAGISLVTGLAHYLSPTSSIFNILNMINSGLSYNDFVSKNMLNGILMILAALIILYIIGKRILGSFSNTSIVNPDIYIKNWKLLNICFLVIFLNHVSYFMIFNNFQLQSLIISLWIFLIAIYLLLNKWSRA